MTLESELLREEIVITPRQQMVDICGANANESGNCWNLLFGCRLLTRLAGQSPATTQAWAGTSRPIRLEAHSGSVQEGVEYRWASQSPLREPRLTSTPVPDRSRPLQLKLGDP